MFFSCVLKSTIHPIAWPDSQSCLCSQFLLCRRWISSERLSGRTRPGLPRGSASQHPDSFLEAWSSVVVFGDLGNHETNYHTAGVQTGARILQCWQRCLFYRCFACQNQQVYNEAFGVEGVDVDILQKKKTYSFQYSWFYCYFFILRINCSTT